MNKKLLVTLSLTGLAVAAIWWANRPDLIEVKTIPVEYGTVEATVSNTRAGTIKACRRSKLSMPSGGVVDRLLVKEGDAVDTGQLLLELWNHDFKAERAKAESSLQATLDEQRQACEQSQFAAREAKRQHTLLQKKLTSEEAADSAETLANTSNSQCKAASAMVEVARSHLQLQNALLDRTRLHAPFAGVIAEINGEVGEYVTPSPPGVATPPAVDLIDYSCLYVTAPIDEIDAGLLKVGLNVNVTLDAFRNRTFTGTLQRIAPYVLDLEKQARTVDVDVKLIKPPEDVELLVGYSADLTVILARRDNTLRIPTETLIDNQWVWVVGEDKRARKQTVKTGLSNWSFTEILSGLKADEQVVITPDIEGLADDIEVTINND